MMDGLPDAVQKHIWDRACEDAKSWPPDIDSKEGLSVIMGPKGMGTLLFTALSRGMPSLTREQAEEMAGEATMEEAIELFGLMLPEAASPKAPAPDQGPAKA